MRTFILILLFARRHLFPFCVLFIIGCVLCQLAPAQTEDGAKQLTKPSEKKDVHHFDKDGKLHSRPLARIVPQASSPAPVRGAISSELENANPDCGVNALYALLKLNDISCSRQSLMEELSPKEKGSTMLELKTVARAHGLVAEIVQTTPFQAQTDVPFIARMTTNRPNQETDGHYVVVTSMGEERVEVIDSTGGWFVRMNRQTFDKRFSGYSLIRSSTPTSTKVIRTALGMLCVIQLLVCLRLLALRERHRAEARAQPLSF
jgi:Peptidase C39 family